LFVNKKPVSKKTGLLEEEKAKKKRKGVGQTNCSVDMSSSPKKKASINKTTNNSDTRASSISSLTSPSSLSNSVTWEKVALSPLDLLTIQIDQELQLLEAIKENTKKQNKYGVDLDPLTGKASGKLRVKVLEVCKIKDAFDSNPLLSGGLGEQKQQVPKVYASASISPSSACEKSTKKHQRTKAVEMQSEVAHVIQWNDSLVFEGIKNKNFTLRIGVHGTSGVIADILLGEVELDSSGFEDQLPHEMWFNLKESGRIRLAITFEYDTATRLESKIAALKKKKQELEEYHEAFKANAPAVKSHTFHPAAHGKEAAVSGLYIPGLRFKAEAHHPAAVSTTPLPEKSRVVTPYGRGVIVSFRMESKMYIVQMDSVSVSSKPTIAYLRQDIVKEEPNEPYLRMHMKVTTPYGEGEIEEIRSHDDIVVVKSQYARLFMQRRDIKLPAKKITDMATKDLIAEAVTLTQKGNDLYRANELDNAVFSYLQALGYIQYVNQDTATYKEKAIILQTMIRCHLNIGASKLKLNAYQDAFIACTNAISILTVLSQNRDGNVVKWMVRLDVSEQQIFEDWPSKAHFRRAQANVKLENYEEAKNDLVIAVRLSPKDKSCRHLLDRVSKIVSQQKSKEKKTWGKIFDDHDDGEEEKDEHKQASTNTIAPKTNKQDSNVVETSIFTRKSKKERDTEKKAQANEEEPWYATTAAFAAASVLTAGIAAMAIVALKQQRS
jgi:tetratricopeptide (TPR) repeat protein